MIDLDWFLWKPKATFKVSILIQMSFSHTMFQIFLSLFYLGWYSMHEKEQFLSWTVIWSYGNFFRNFLRFFYFIRLFILIFAVSFPCSYGSKEPKSIFWCRLNNELSYSASSIWKIRFQSSWNQSQMLTITILPSMYYWNIWQLLNFIYRYQIIKSKSSLLLHDWDMFIFLCYDYVSWDSREWII